MKINTSTLAEVHLDYAVAIALGAEADFEDGECFLTFEHTFGALSRFDYHKNWALTGPLLHRERIGVKCHQSPALGKHYSACIWDEDGLTGRYPQAGSDELEAVLRCFVASKLGAEVEIPEELCAIARQS